MGVLRRVVPYQSIPPTTTIDLTPTSTSRRTHQRICFAKGKSDATALRDGTYEPKAKRQKREAKERARVRCVLVTSVCGKCSVVGLAVCADVSVFRRVVVFVLESKY